MAKSHNMTTPHSYLAHVDGLLSVRSGDSKGDLAEARVARMLQAGTGLATSSHTAACNQHMAHTCQVLHHSNRSSTDITGLQVATGSVKQTVRRRWYTANKRSLPVAISVANAESSPETHARYSAQVASTPSAEEIAARIAASRERRATREFIKCPACSIGVASPAAMHRHMRNCCADLLDESTWQQVLACLPHGPTAAAPPAWPPLRQLLSVAAAREQAARDAVLQATFHSGIRDAQGRLVRQTADAVAAQLSLPTARVSRLLSAAMRAVPLVADADPVHVLHECQHFLAVNKPAGVQTAPVHRFKGGSMVNRVLHYLKASPHVLHRLDMDTSGVLLFAKTPAVTSAVHQQFRKRQVGKMYVCVCQGIPPQHQWDEHGMIGRHPTVTVARSVKSAAASTAGCVDQQTVHTQYTPQPNCSSITSSSECSEDDQTDGPQWQQAHTSFLRLLNNPMATLADATPGAVYAGPTQPQGASVVAAAPHSGRTHQIRVHMAAVGHPLLGDELYGLQGPWIQRQALHAARLRITHPITKEPLIFSAPLPADSVSLIQGMGLEAATQAGKPGMGALGTNNIEQLIEQAWRVLHP